MYSGNTHPEINKCSEVVKDGTNYAGILWPVRKLSATCSSIPYFCTGNIHALNQ